MTQTLQAAEASDFALPAGGPGDVLAEVTRARAAADAAEVAILELAIAWADAHPLDPDLIHPGTRHPLTGEATWVDPVARTDEADHEAGTWFGLPAITWDAPAAFAAANHMTTSAGARLIRDALQLSHRLPRTWRRVRSGAVPAWRARRIADTVAGTPDDVAAYIDDHVHAVAGTVGIRTLDRLLDEAMLRLHAEERELDQLDALDRRHATLHTETINHTGIVEITLRGDYADLAALDATLSEVAAALSDSELASLVGMESCAPGQQIDVRRALAAGVLADPHGAGELLDAFRNGVLSDAPSTRRPAKHAVLHVHVTHDALYDLEPVARLEAVGGVPVLTEQVRTWLGRTDTHVVVRPVLDTTTAISVDRYEIPDRIRDHVAATHTTCTFPWCQRPVAACDLDRLEPWRDDGSGGSTGGQTSTDNLAAACRHHHRLKTLAGWRVARIETGVYVWTDPHGREYVRTPLGTRARAQHDRG